MKLNLRPYQQKAIDDLYSWMGDNDGNPLVVIPTGGGKSLVIAKLVEDILTQWPTERIIIITHVKELVAQNYKELLGLMPHCPAGIYSAGLRSRDKTSQVLFCSIQSVHKKAYELQKCDLILVDEAHLIPNKESGMYRKFISDMKAINGQHLRVVGLTATPFRMDTGMLHTGDNALFDGIAHETPMLELIEAGYLCPLISKATATRLDVTGVGTRGGEFIASQLEAAVDHDEITAAAVNEVVQFGQDRRSWLLFGAGKKHCGHILDAMRERGVAAEAVFGDTPNAERDAIIERFRHGKLRALVSINALTTGFNVKSVDLIALLRPTKSAGLYCLDEETEILTSHGWRGIGGVREGDCAATLDMSSGAGKWSRVTAYIEREMMDDERWVQYDAPRANFRVTSDHNLIFSKATHGGGWSDYAMLPAFMAASLKDGIKMPTAVTIDQPGIPLTDAELYFIGMMMSDGTFTPFQATIYQSERYPEVIGRIERCLNECGFAWTKRVVNCPSSFKSGFDRWAFTISAGKPRCGKPGTGFRHLMPFLDKDLSPSLMSLSRAQFLSLLQGIWDGDGSKKANVTDYTPRSWEICSARRVFVDRLQALASIHGFTANLRWQSKGRTNPIGVITITPKDWRTVGGSGDRPQVTISDPTNERVWCVQTETGTIVTRRRGKVTVMGNCQIVGRGTRCLGADIHESIRNGKSDCLVLDFAGVVSRFGPVDQIKVVDRKKGDGGEAPTKECPQCESICHASARECADCGFVFPEPTIKIEARSSALPILSTERVDPNWLRVDKVFYRRHDKAGGTPSLCVVYQCGMVQHKEYVCIQHAGFPRQKACTWWSRRAPGQPIPASVDEALERVSALAVPAEIAVRPVGRYVEISGHRF